MKYLVYQFQKNISAGLNHQTSNLISLIVDAYLSNRIPVLVSWNLDSKHNNGLALRSTLRNYYDLQKIIVEGKVITPIDRLPISVSREDIRIVNNGTYIDPEWKHTVVIRKIQKIRAGLCRYLLPHDTREQRLKVQKLLQSVNFSKTHSCRIIGKKIAKRILRNGPFIGLHIRRKDRALFDSQWEKATRMKHVIEVIKHYQKNNQIKNIFVMSDEPISYYLSSLNRQGWKVLTSSHYQNIFEKHSPNRVEKDNYFRFIVEQEIFKRGDIQINTQSLLSCLLSDC